MYVKVSLRGRGERKQMEFCEFQRVLKKTKIKFWVKGLGGSVKCVKICFKKNIVRHC